MNKKMLLTSICVLSLSVGLSACSQPETIINRVPLVDTHTARLQESINKGFTSPYEDHASEWSKYAIRITSGCPIDLKDLSVDTNSFEMPVFEGNGHMVKHFMNGSYSLYVQPTYRKDYQNIEHVNLKVDVAYKTSAPEYIFSKDMQIPEGTLGQGLPQTYSLWRFKTSHGALCQLQATILPSSGTLSKAIWFEGVGTDSYRHIRSGAFGNQLPQESGGETLSDVMHHSGGGSGYIYRSPDFHDPFNVDQGGMGPMAR